jgi:hypothetical protein
VGRHGVGLGHREPALGQLGERLAPPLGIGRVEIPGVEVDRLPIAVVHRGDQQAAATAAIGAPPDPRRERRHRVREEVGRVHVSLVVVSVEVPQAERPTARAERGGDGAVVGGAVRAAAELEVVGGRAAGRAGAGVEVRLDGDDLHGVLLLGSAAGVSATSTSSTGTLKDP